jgi:hypothetical protein
MTQKFARSGKADCLRFVLSRPLAVGEPSELVGCVTAAEEDGPGAISLSAQ